MPAGARLSVQMAAVYAVRRWLIGFGRAVGDSAQDSGAGAAVCLPPIPGLDPFFVRHGLAPIQMFNVRLVCMDL